jgi:hypothetical protein
MTLLAPRPITSRGECPTVASSLERQPRGDALPQFGGRFGKWSAVFAFQSFPIVSAQKVSASASIFASRV